MAQPTARQKRQCQQTGARLDPRCHRQRPLPPPRSAPPTSRRPRVPIRITSRRCTPLGTHDSRASPSISAQPADDERDDGAPSGRRGGGAEAEASADQHRRLLHRAARERPQREAGRTLRRRAKGGAAEGRGGATAEGRTRQGAPGEGQLRRRQRRRGRGALGAIAVDGGRGRRRRRRRRRQAARQGLRRESFRRQAEIQLAGRGVVVPQRLRLHDQPAELDARPQKPLPGRSGKDPRSRRRRRRRRGPVEAPAVGE